MMEAVGTSAIAADERPRKEGIRQSIAERLKRHRNRRHAIRGDGNAQDAHGVVSMERHAGE